jgi:hypothetical protein
MPSGMKVPERILVLGHEAAEGRCASPSGTTGVATRKGEGEMNGTAVAIELSARAFNSFMLKGV